MASSKHVDWLGACWSDERNKFYCLFLSEELILLVVTCSGVLNTTDSLVTPIKLLVACFLISSLSRSLLRSSRSMSSSSSSTVPCPRSLFSLQFEGLSKSESSLVVGLEEFADAWEIWVESGVLNAISPLTSTQGLLFVGVIRFSSLESAALVCSASCFSVEVVYFFSTSLFVSLEVSASLVTSVGYFLAGEDDLLVSSWSPWANKHLSPYLHCPFSLQFLHISYFRRLGAAVAAADTVVVVGEQLLPLLLP